VRVLAAVAADRAIESIRAVHDLNEAYVVERDELVMVLELTTLANERRGVRDQQELGGSAEPYAVTR
jgi:hypothetical protein